MPPSVHGFDDFRAFLRAWYLHQKAHRRRYSFGVFARRAGIASRSHLKLVMDGRRNLGRQMVEKYVKGLDLAGEEAECFRLLVAAGQARDPAERLAAAGAHRRWVVAHRMRWVEPRRASSLMRSWATYLVLGLTRTADFRPDPRWISRRLAGRITPAQAADALRLLSDEGLIRLRGRRLLSTMSGRLQMSNRGGVPIDLPRVHARLRREAADPWPHDHDYAASLCSSAILTRGELEEIHGKLREWVMEHLPISRQRAKGELCVFLTDFFAISRPPGATR